MASPEHLEILKQGVEAWNKWREENPDIDPDLSGVDLYWANLSKADLSKADLSKTDLSKIDLSKANLSKANLSEAYLLEANLSETYLPVANLSEAELASANLSGAYLSSANLSGAYLNSADLSGAYLNSADLSGAFIGGADLSKADLSLANLSGAELASADLSRADLSITGLSGCKLNEKTSISKIIGCRIGVNGFYCPKTKTAALMDMVPEGDSMRGSNPDTVVDNLKHAKKLHFASMSLVGISLLLLVLHIPTLKLPFGLTEKEVDAINFATLSVIISFGLCSLTAFFFSSALEGAKYINDRESAMKIGHFPWTLSKYEHVTWRRWLSVVARTVLCFHPVAYLPFFFNLQSLFSGQWLNIVNDTGSLPIALLYLLPLFGLLLFAACIWIFMTSLGFLKPILFDPETEAERKSDIEKMTEAIKEQTTKMDELLNVLKGNEEPAKSSDSPPEA